MWLSMVPRDYQPSKILIGDNLKTFYVPYSEGVYFPVIAYVFLIVVPCVCIFSVLLSSWFGSQFEGIRNRIIAVNIFDSLLAHDYPGEEKDIIPDEFKGFTVSQNNIKEWY